MSTIANTTSSRMASLEALAALPKTTAPHEAFTKGPGSHYMESIVEGSRVPIGTLDGNIQGKLKTLKDQPGNIGLLIELQMEVGHRSLVISTTTGALKTAKDDASTVARAV